MQVGRAFRKSPVAPHRDEFREAFCCTEKLSRMKPGSAALFPPSQQLYLLEPQNGLRIGGDDLRVFGLRFPDLEGAFGAAPTATCCVRRPEAER